MSEEAPPNFPTTHQHQSPRKKTKKKKTKKNGNLPQVKVHFDSTVYKSDEWIHTSSQRLATLGSHTAGARRLRCSFGCTGTPRSGVPGATGLTNLGNTCFMNATLQCMVNTPLVREYFLSSQHLRDISERRGSSSKGRLAQEFGHVLLELWSGKSAVVSPRNLKRAIDQFAPQFAGYEQHDAQERESKPQSETQRSRGPVNRFRLLLGGGLCVCDGGTWSLHDSKLDMKWGHCPK
ncbi:unnamed protein product [Effrenium voratum]|nr:unnamed protein product [Effrenium voratum]